MSSPEAAFVELFLQEASEHLQFLREYGGILLDSCPAPDEVERLYVAAHTLKGSSAMYGYPLFSDVAGKLAHIFQYAMNLGIGQDAAAPLVEFISEAVAVLESDLLVIHDGGAENVDEIAAFKRKYPFAFQQASETPAATAAASLAPGLPAEVPVAEPGAVEAPEGPAAALPGLTRAERSHELPPEGEIAAEVLEFFVPEAEEHLQTATECLLALEANPNTEDIHRLFRAMHTLKGAAAQVGLPRIALLAHHAEDLIGRLRDGDLQPSADIIDLCLDAVDALKKFLYRQWPDEATLQTGVKALLKRITRFAPEEKQGPTAPAPSAVAESLTLPAGAAFPAEQTLLEQQDQPAPGDIDAVEPLPGETAALRAVELDAHAPETEESEPGELAPSELPLVLDRASPETIAAAAGTAGSDVVLPLAVAPPGSQPATATDPALGEFTLPETPPPKKAATVPTAKSVRIALERLDRMMNAVGELVINRTRMLGRLAELEKLADVLNFSKARMSDKIVEFQDKYEFSRVHAASAASLGSVRWDGDAAPAPPPLAHAATPFPFRGGYSSYSHSFDSSLAEFGELEMDRYDDFNILSRSLTEISADITEILTQLDTFVRRVDSDIDEFTKLAHRLQDEITQARMVPIGNLYTRISRTVRDAAKAAGKQVELELAGAETELDNNIIQQIADPLLHLVRNAVAHGLEREEERYLSGKPDHGKVAVRAYHRGNHIYIEVEDDGRGIDWEHVRATACHLGLVEAEDAARMSDRELQELLFHPGFSTAPRKSELAGRGVGLDVVRTNVAAMNGEIEIETQKGSGTRFTLKVPLTLIISQALFVQAGKQVFALPLAFVEEIRRVRKSDIEEVAGKRLTKVRDVVTEIVRFDEQLGLESPPPAGGYCLLVLVNVAGRPVAVVVDEVLRKDEIVIKNLGEYLRNVKLFPGATIAPDGSLILLVDVNRLIAGEAIERRPLMTAANAAIPRVVTPAALPVAASGIPAAALEPMVEEKVVVLADDSISVRKFVGRMLEKAGYRVKLAADGLEALEILAETRCDLVVTDLEMPRTNGYELMAHLRQNAETRHIPIMVVTSRAGAKHRDKALRQGAVEFLVKPVQEDQFITAVHALIGPAAARARTAVV